MSDLLGVFGHDIFGTLLDPTPSKVRAAQLLVERLKAIPHESLYESIDVRERPDMFGWGIPTQLMTASIDAMNLNSTLTVRTAMNGNKDYPVFPAMPNPFVKTEEERKKDIEESQKANLVVQKAPEITPENSFSSSDAEGFFKRN